MLRLRELTKEESVELERLARSRTAAAARLVARAREGEGAPDIGREPGVSEEMASCWRARFHARGLGGLAAAARSGRPPTYPAEVGEVIAARLTKP